jgi:organic radical activating enzyme
MSYWCNYRCHYCRQDHRRDAGHWNDIADVQTWLSAIQAHFRDKELSITLTGGEPMIHVRPADQLLDALQEFADIRVDTNGSFNPDSFCCRRDRVQFMVSYHPSEVSESDFLKYVDRILAAGFSISMVQLVVLPDRFELLETLRSKLPVPVSAMPVFGSLQYYSQDQIATLRKHIPDRDWFFRSGHDTAGIDCLYPSLAYEMDYTGKLWVACHEKEAGSIFAEQLPALPQGYVSCPKDSCTCVDRYTFAKMLDLENLPTPTHSYTTRLRSLL